MQDSLAKQYNIRFRSIRIKEPGLDRNFQLSRRQVQKLACRLMLANCYLKLLSNCAPILKSMDEKPSELIKKFWIESNCMLKIITNGESPTKDEFFAWYFSFQ